MEKSKTFFGKPDLSSSSSGGHIPINPSKEGDFKTYKSNNDKINQLVYTFIN